MNYKIYPLGERAATIDFGNVISPELNDLVIRLGESIAQSNFAGLIECVPAFSTLTVFYDVSTVRKNQPDLPNAFNAVRQIAVEHINNLSATALSDPRILEIPVSFATECAPDLEFVADVNGLTMREVISVFLSTTYRVFMLGFLPGFAYMGELDERIAAPRKETPRDKVVRGSVGIAGRQTGIYPFESPGGWQIIGRTGIRLFDPDKEDPTLFQAGDLVRFIEN